ncbi:uncharacterized protein LOC121257536 [Juglans microcarpa x Juglans regia]|uniref:uncharacterized protein LOC121257536 n=1 Tax=Juglans microcarpa x Juglans regia TaxID=2249226 RepID=UPI001B7E1744|nr:uncharacterized protein LOC121257536 [Juglans microcarpa x Juglans regia]XP_041014502.1 uncharacterized protein LOC121257536 [Juglans microcarpa x Juglans regia]
MAVKGNVLPDCVNASNPFHECTESCRKKIAQGQAFKNKKKSGSILLNVSRSFGRRKKEGSEPKSPQAHDNITFQNTVYPSDFASKREVESEITEDFPHPRAHAKETRTQNPSLNKSLVSSSHLVPKSGILISPDSPIDYPEKNSTHIYGERPNNQEEDEKLYASSYAVPNPVVDDMEEHGNGSAAESMSFSFFDISDALEGNQEGDVQSEISDSRVSVGRYHLKESLASILQSIFNKYGDIAASCQLESMSLRSYYLECLCFVVKELQSSSIIHLTKAKLKELLAILKDVESSQIDISWLRHRIDEITADIELISQHRSIEAAKANFDRDLELTRKELASRMEDLSLKEKEVDIAKKQVAKTRARLSKLELKISQLNENILSIRTKVENSHGRSSLLDELL